MGGRASVHHNRFRMTLRPRRTRCDAYKIKKYEAENKSRILPAEIVQGFALLDKGRRRAGSRETLAVNELIGHHNIRSKDSTACGNRARPRHSEQSEESLLSCAQQEGFLVASLLGMTVHANLSVMSRLQFEHFGITAAVIDQLVVRPLLGNRSIFQNENAIGHSNRGKTVRN